MREGKSIVLVVSLRFERRQKGESAEYMQFLSSFSHVFSLFFSFARYVGQWRIPFPRVSLNFITLLEKRSGKGKEKRKKAVAPFIPRFINYRLFHISSLPAPIHCMRPRWKRSRGLCLSHFAFCIRRVLFAEGWEKEGKNTNKAEKKEG